VFRYVADNIGGSLITDNLEEHFNTLRESDARFVVQDAGSYKGKVHYGTMLGPAPRPMIKTASVDYKKTTPLIQDPRTSFLALQVPEDRVILNQLYRYYDATDPIIQNAHRLHTEFPLANMMLADCGDPAVQKHFEEVWYDRIQGPTLLLDIGIEYNRLGNVVLFGAWNATDLMWDKLALLNIDNIKIEDTWLAQRPLIKLIPDENLKKIVNTQRPWSLYKQLHPEIIKYVRLHKEIPLDPANVWHITYNRAPYEVWGDPPVKSLLKLLFYETKLMDAQIAIAMRHIVPITLVRVGSEKAGWLPDESELADIQELLAARELDPNMSIIYHYGLNIDYIGATGKVLPVQQELTRIDELKLMGLGISKAFLGGEGGPTYSNASVALAVLRQRYLHITRKFSQFVEKGLFQPIADACGFYKTEKTVVGAAGARRVTYGDISKEANELRKQFKESSIRDFKDNQEFKEFLIARAVERLKKAARENRQYVFPKLDWNLITLAGDIDWRRWVSEFNSKFQTENGLPLVSESTLYRLLQLDEMSERKNVIREARERKIRLEMLRREGIPVQTQNQAGLGGELPFMGGGGGGFELPPIGGEEGGPTMEEPLGTPGMMGEELPTGGGLGEVGLPESPASQDSEHITKTASKDPVLDILEQEIATDLQKEIKGD